MSDLYALARNALAGLRVLLAATLVCGLVYPVVVTGLAQAGPGWRADGSLVDASGGRTRDASQAVGSVLIGQSVDDEALFLPRPSAAGEGYDPLSTAGSNLGPESPELVQSIRERQAEVAEREGVEEHEVPPDAVTASASGLDPHISPAYAELQVARVARANGLDDERVAQLVTDHTDGRGLGFLGGVGVNVLELNLAVSRVAAGGG